MTGWILHIAVMALTSMVCFKYVSPTCGPIRIYGDKAKIAFSRATGRQTDEYLANVG